MASPFASTRGSSSTAAARIRTAVGSLAEGSDRFVLAVSGGVDSMVLLHAIGEGLGEAARSRVSVACFDHATGPHARKAVEVVRAVAERCGMSFETERSTATEQSEAAWREARWRFLHRIASKRNAAVVTAHTLDDHLETIVMRALRGAGARGLSALRAPSSVRRPLVGVLRADIMEYARTRDVSWVEDPSNLSRAYLRNRVRLDLLPAMRSVDSCFVQDMLALADRAAELRRTLGALVRPLVRVACPERVVAIVKCDAEWNVDACALYWQTVAEMAGLALDWRGTARLARFSRNGRSGTRIPLSGGFEAVCRGDEIELRRRPAMPPESVTLALPAETCYGAWRFRPATETTLREVDTTDPWRAWLPVDGTLEVRAWRDGDRMMSAGIGRRRVKRFFADRRVAAPDREGWPVVIADGEIVWIPGVRRARAAADRSGRPSVCIVCDRLDN